MGWASCHLLGAQIIFSGGENDSIPTDQPMAQRVTHHPPPTTQLASSPPPFKSSLWRSRLAAPNEAPRLRIRLSQAAWRESLERGGFLRARGGTFSRTTLAHLKLCNTARAASTVHPRQRQALIPHDDSGCS